MALRIKKGDLVQVLSGKDRGRRGEVTRVLPKEGRVLVERINVAKRHMRPTRRLLQGGIIEKDLPLPISKVAIVCEKCGPTRIGVALKDGRKVRICKKCGEEL